MGRLSLHDYPFMKCQGFGLMTKVCAHQVLHSQTQPDQSHLTGDKVSKSVDLSSIPFGALRIALGSFGGITIMWNDPSLGS